MRLSLEREGSFRAINMIGSHTKCGSLDNYDYRYAVRIEATDDRLSPEGFVIDNARCQDYFIEKYASGRSYPAVSCEKMAMQAAHDFGAELLAAGISVTQVTVTIFGSNTARLTATWDAPKARRTSRAPAKRKTARAKRLHTTSLFATA